MIKRRDCFLEYINFKNNSTEYKCLRCNENYQKTFGKNLKKLFLKNAGFLTRISIGLFHCYEKVFTHMNKWMTEKNSMKLYYLKEKILRVT